MIDVAVKPDRFADEANSEVETLAGSPVSVTGSQRNEPALSVSSFPAKVLNTEYAVRGRIAQRGLALEQELDQKAFDEIVPCHIGNPMSLGQHPLTYIRQCVSLCADPTLLEKDDSVLNKIYNSASVTRARRYMKSLTSPGAYTISRGAIGLRHAIADFLERRDGFSTHIDQIYMTNGASDGIETLLTCLISGPKDGIMIPVPQYPLYTASITKLDGTAVPYYLNEANGWSLSYDGLVEHYDSAVLQGIDVKAIVIICPGNPVPTMLSYEQVKEILIFAEEKNLVVLADEVYQENAYDPERPHFPFRRVLLESGLKAQLVSFHSSSKGYYGECGFRAGFFQMENVAPEAAAVIYKMRNIALCSNTMGQVVMACVCDPPKPDDQDYEQYLSEKTLVFEDLRQKAKMTYDFFNSLTGVTCQPICGALYAFPNIALSRKAQAAAKEQNMSPDLFYSMELLENTGIVVTNGSGFGQQAGTHHIRMTILPPIGKLPGCFERYRKFHEDFMEKYSD